MTDCSECIMHTAQQYNVNRTSHLAGSWLWNCLAVELRQRDMRLSEFRRLLKTFLRLGALWLFLFKCGVYKYAYLLTYISNHVKLKQTWRDGASGKYERQ